MKITCLIDNAVLPSSAFWGEHGLAFTVQTETGQVLFGTGSSGRVLSHNLEAAQTNLLLNRASPWLDIDSHLPYEGKVVIRNKRAWKLAVRIPRRVDKTNVTCGIKGYEVGPTFLGNYLRLDSVAAGDTITVKSPMAEATEEHTLGWSGLSHWTEETSPKVLVGPEGWRPPVEPDTYSCQFKGNTLVDISPRSEGPGYPPISPRALQARGGSDADSRPLCLTEDPNLVTAVPISFRGSL